MRRRYLTKSNEDHWMLPVPRSCEIFERDPEPVPTGVLDQYGDMIYAVERLAVGFLHSKD